MLNPTHFTLFSVVRESFPGSGVWEKHAEQDNYPNIQETLTPPSAVFDPPPNEAYVVARRWQWSATISSGMPAGMIDFEFSNDEWDNPINRYRKQARLKFINFNDGNAWHNGNQVIIDIDLVNDMGDSQSYTGVPIDLRSLEHIEFTIIKDQNDIEPSIIHQDPASGSAYMWTLDAGSSGLTPTPTLMVSFQAGDTYNKQGRIGVSWAGAWYGDGTGQPVPEGTFTLEIADGTRQASIFNGLRSNVFNKSQPQISLRQLVGNGYTLIKNQNSGGNGVSFAGATAAGFTIDADGFSGFTPALPPGFLTISSTGAITSHSVYAGIWNQEGNFDLTIKDGDRPGSTFNSRSLYIRELISDGHTLIRNQTSGGDGINKAGANGFVFKVESFSGFTPTPGEGTLQFNSMGAITDFAYSNSWDQAGNIELTIFDGAEIDDDKDITRPSSTFSARALMLRQLSGEGYLLFEEQLGKTGDGVNSPGESGFTFSITAVGGTLPAGLTGVGAVVFDSMGAVTSWNAFLGSTWDENGSFTLEVQDGTRPNSILDGAVLAGSGITLEIGLRHLSPSDITIPLDGSDVEISVSGDTGPWTWSGFNDGLLGSTVTADYAPGLPSGGMTVAGTPGSMTFGESGTATLSVQPSDGSRPTSPLSIGIEVEDQVPELLDGTDQLTIFAVVRDDSLIAQQDNYPNLTINLISTDPTGDPWQWEFVGSSGFTSSPVVSFVGDGNTVGLNVSGFETSDFENGVDGTLEVRVSNTGQAVQDSVTVDVSLRSIPTIDFTVLKNQTSAEKNWICDPAVPPSPPREYTWSVESPAGFANTPTITFDFDAGDTANRGGMVSVEFLGQPGNWSDADNTTDGNFTLKIQDGTRQESVFDGSLTASTGHGSLPKLSTRSLTIEGYALFQQQSGATGNGISAAGAEGFTFDITAVGGTLPAGLTGAGAVVFSALGAVTSWNKTLGSTWTENGTFTLLAKDGIRPGSYLDGAVLAGSGVTLEIDLRRLEPTTLMLLDDNTAGEQDIEVNGDASNWSWSAFSHDLTGGHVITPNYTPSGFNGMKLSWTDTGLKGAEAGGTANLTVQHPSSRPEVPCSLPISITTSAASLDHTALTVVAKLDGMTLDFGASEITLTTNKDPADESPPGTAWTWDADNISSDFSSAVPAITFTYPNDGAGESNEKHKQAVIHVDFDLVDFDNAVSGTFDLHLKIGLITKYTFPMNLSLRRFYGGYTIFEGHLDGGDGLSGPGDDGGFDISVLGLTIPGLTSPTLELGVAGEITNFGFSGATWNEDGSCNLVFQDGSRPSQQFNSVPVLLRKLGVDGYVVFENQTNGGPSVSLGNYTFEAVDFGGTSALSITFDGGAAGQGRVTGVSGSTSWNESGTMTLQVANGDHPYSEFIVDLLVRRLTPNPLRIPVLETEAVGDEGTADVVVEGDATTDWDWSGLSESLPSSTFGVDSTTAKQLTLGWAAGALTPADSGTWSIGVTKTSGFSAPSSTVTLLARVRGHFSLLVVAGGTTTLPGATENRRYEAEIRVDDSVLPEPIEAGDTVTWEIGPGFGSVFEHVAGSDNLHRFIRTLQTPVTYIPEGWGGSTQTIPVRAKHYRDSVMINGGNWTDLSLNVADQKDDYDVAVLLDRSGSMSGQRWQAAINGAEIFAALVGGANTIHVGGDPDNPLHQHRVGIYWFWGHDSWSYGDNYPNPSPDADPTYPDGFSGTFIDDSDPSNVKDFSLDGGAALSNTSDIVPVGNAHGVGHFTALGSGLLLCRKELLAPAVADPDQDRKRMVLLLTDGMENREPMLEQLFVSPGLWFQDEDDPSEAMDPETRVYSCAVFTGASYAAKLGDVAGYTGGVAATDVKQITDPVDYGLQMQHWFINRFSAEFDFVETTAPADPTLDPGEMKKHKVKVNLGQDKLVFYMLSAAPDAGGMGWRFVIRPPEAPGTIEPVHHNPAQGITYKDGSLYKMYIIDLPLAIPGHGHRWAGEWEMHVERTGSTAGSYAAGSLAHQDVMMKTEVLAPPIPKPGDKAILQVMLKKGGSAIKDATVSAVVRHPGAWPGHEVACMIASNLDVVKKLRRSTSAANQDTPNLADKVVRAFYEQQGAIGQKTKKYPLVPINPMSSGIYQTEISLVNPGQYTMDISVLGTRKSSIQELRIKLGNELKVLRSTYDGRALTKERSYLDKKAGSKQDFAAEDRKQVFVNWVPDPLKTEVQGYFVDAKTIRLGVQPRDGKDKLLGPGWDDNVEFAGPPGILQKWPARDFGDGSYWVDIPFESKGLRFYLGRPVAVASSMSLIHPHHGPITPPKMELPMDGFKVSVFGVDIPITVYALIGNKKTKEVHLATCTYVEMMADNNKVWLHDLDEARRVGYDTCEWCLPLVCNTNPSSMEAHKPFCSHADRISPNNRLEVHSWKEAEKLGFDGCYYCLPDKHTR